MNAWGRSLVNTGGNELSAGARRELDDAGFTIVPGPVPPEDLPRLAAAYDAAVAGAAPEDVKVASSTTRVSDSSIAARSSICSTCSRPFSRHAVASSMSRSNSARCMPARYGQVCRPRISTWISSVTVAVGLCSASSSWWTSSELTTARRVSCRALTSRPQFRRP